jgi:isoleucyl-tRNA synthetase
MHPIPEGAGVFMETPQMFKPVSSKVDFPSLERGILDWWQQESMMEKYLHHNDSSERRFSFIDGPITANNPMGVHHAWGRTYKDLFQRYKTMQGFKQRYQNGFDGQGLWIEVEVEKELGFRSKKDIEEYGIDKFVELCKERVQRFANIQTEQSIRMGYWMDWENSYHTLSDQNNYTIWHFLKVCHDNGWIYEGTDVMPWCPRCGTGLSEHEIATEGYREIVHPGVFLRLPLKGREAESLLVWTTTPWTLSSNSAAAVNPNLTYVSVRQEEQIYYLAKSRLSVLNGEYTVTREMLGKELIGLDYLGPFDELPVQQGVEHRVVGWKEVTEEEGTGIVHIAPGAGKEDFALGKEQNLTVIAPLDDSGNFLEGFGWLTGLNVSAVNKPIFDDLRQKGILYQIVDYPHRYPVCWRCETELVFRLVNEWFISMDELRHKIANVTRRIKWIPDFGMKRELDWLQNMGDWMISKKRYWGLALPIYKCASCGHFDVIGSELELRDRAIAGWSDYEGHSPHRPWVDSVRIQCTKCGESVSRISDVGNPWLDAGIVPFSTLDYQKNREYWSQWFPADWISESFPGQFRNWFYSLLTMSTVLENEEPFRCVFSYALMRDEHGEEMHKSRGNAIWLDEAAEEIGIDPMRWVFMSQNPSTNLNFGYNIVVETVRHFLLTLWNTYSFFVTYANIDNYDPTKSLPSEPTSELDRWILSELNTLILDVTAYLDNYNSSDATKRIESFVQGLSNWYVRRSRRRFWKSENDQDKSSAYATLYQCLVAVSRLMSPFTPFLAEEIYQNLVRQVDSASPESVHLTSWPVANESLIDRQLSQATALGMRVTSLGRAARSKAQVRVRQPLQRVLVKPRTHDEITLLQMVATQVLEELNVKEIDFLEEETTVVEFRLRLNHTAIGPRYGQQIRQLELALSEANSDELVRKVQSGETVYLATYRLEPDDLLIEPIAREGYSIAQDSGYTVALETSISTALREEGLARELVHRIQNLRRSAGFDIADHITLWYKGSGSVMNIMNHPDLGEYVRQEALANSVVEGTPDPGSHEEAFKLDGQEVTFGVKRVSN